MPIIPANLNETWWSTPIQEMSILMPSILNILLSLRKKTLHILCLPKTLVQQQNNFPKLCWVQTIAWSQNSEDRYLPDIYHMTQLNDRLRLRLRESTGFASPVINTYPSNKTSLMQHNQSSLTRIHDKKLKLKLKSLNRTNIPYAMFDLCFSWSMMVQKERKIGNQGKTFGNLTI